MSEGSCFKSNDVKLLPWYLTHQCGGGSKWDNTFLSKWNWTWGGSCSKSYTSWGIHAYSLLSSVWKSRVMACGEESEVYSNFTRMTVRKIGF